MLTFEHLLLRLLLAKMMVLAQLSFSSNATGDMWYSFQQGWEMT
ncbi:MAG: hypothetical protein ABR568_12550 [Pyrinomonadaceae bacterium]